jgi:hypothetical protein
MSNDVIVKPAFGGTIIDPNRGMRDWATDAGLNWKAVDMPILIQGKRENRPYPQKKALVRSDTGAPLEIVGANYKIHQPADLLNGMVTAADKLGAVPDEAGVWQGGGVIWMTAKLPDSFRSNGSTVQLKVLFSTSFGRGLTTRCNATTVNIVCYNTFMLSRRSTASAQSHRSDFDASQINASLDAIRAEFQSYEDLVHSARQRPIDGIQADALMQELLSAYALRSAVEERIGVDTRQMTRTAYIETVAERAELLYDPEWFSPRNRAAIGLRQSYHEAPAASPGNLYGLLQAATHYADHVRGRDTTRNEQATFGAGNQLKQSARIMVEQLVH